MIDFTTIPNRFRIMLVFAVGYLSTFILTQYYIKKATQKGIVVPDMYKKHRPMIPSMGGLAILGGTIVALIITQFLVPNVIPLLIFYFVVMTYCLYGLTDDLLGFKKRKGKILILFFLALPIAILTSDTNISFFFINLELGVVYAFIFAPIYIMVVANLMNMHAGFNGLPSGLTLIILAFACVKLYLLGMTQNILLIMPLLGALLAFYYYNMYPSRVFLGNNGSFLIGSAVGAFFVLTNMEFFGIIILIPHIINFLMWAYWKRIMHRVPHEKFARVMEDGTLEAPNRLTMKYLVISLFRLTERQAVMVLYGITAFFGVVSLVI